MFNFLVTIAGTLFGYGLAISGMVSPAKVIGFLDITGDWDPSLAFVMGGGVVVTAITFKLLLKRSRPIIGKRYYLPQNNSIDSRLIIGAGLFGAGWALGGLCPGPALSSLAYAEPKIVVFVISMIAGIILAKKFFSNQTVKVAAS